VVRSEVEDASAFGAVVMNRFAMGVWHSFEDAVAVWNSDSAMMPDAYTKEKEAAYNGWHDAVKQLLK
jgi:glycerol kinase